MNICAIIVTFNRLEKLKKTIEAYLFTGVDKIVIVNNASTDGTEYFLSEQKKLLSCLDVLSLPNNIGGAGGFHAGLAYARDLSNIDWIVVSDDDSYPTQSALIHFKQQQALAPEYSLFASAVYYPDNEICLMNQPMIIDSFNNMLLKLCQGKKMAGLDLAYYQSSLPTTITASSFVGLFIKHETLVRSRVLPPADFFLYWDDIAFCLDMQKQGFSSQFLPMVKFTHDCPRHSKSLSEERFYFMVRNGIRTIKKFPTHILYFSLPIKLFVWGIIAIKSNSINWFVKAIRDA